LKLFAAMPQDGMHIFMYTLLSRVLVAITDNTTIDITV
jgi:hypothetical protein